MRTQIFMKKENTFAFSQKLHYSSLRDALRKFEHFVHISVIEQATFLTEKFRLRSALRTHILEWLSGNHWLCISNNGFYSLQTS